MRVCGSACFALFKSFSVLAHQQTHRSKRGGGGLGVRGCGGKGVSVGGEEKFGATTRQVARLEKMEVEEEVEEEEEEREEEEETVVTECLGAGVLGFAACLALVCSSL